MLREPRDKPDEPPGKPDKPDKDPVIKPSGVFAGGEIGVYDVMIADAVVGTRGVVWSDCPPWFGLPGWLSSENAFAGGSASTARASA